MKSQQLIAEITANGWTLDRVKGSHHIVRHLHRSGIVVVPHPKKDLPIGTIQSIRRQAGLIN